jgi:integrase
MNEFKSCFALQIQLFKSYRIASGTWSESNFGKILSLFDLFCFNNYPDSTELTQIMVDTWCKKRDTETNNSLSSRIYPIITFIRFLRSRDLTAVIEPFAPQIDHKTFIPHAFTDSELENFFKACDEVSLSLPKKQYILRGFIIPVFFRLLYSSGMRTTEARFLKTEDVDLIHGVLNIRRSKGFDEHFVVLHDTMLTLMRQYDEKISQYFPKRTYFFPGKNDSYRLATWVTYNFKLLWNKYNQSHARAYDLRHNYAIENINSWINSDFNFGSKLQHLSKSMGHSSIESTSYYYSLVPKLADLIDLISDNDSLLPEVYDESK